MAALLEPVGEERPFVSVGNTVTVEQGVAVPVPATAEVLPRGEGEPVGASRVPVALAVGASAVAVPTPPSPSLLLLLELGLDEPLTVALPQPVEVTRALPIPLVLPVALAGRVALPVPVEQPDLLPSLLPLPVGLPRLVLDALVLELRWAVVLAVLLAPSELGVASAEAVPPSSAGGEAVALPDAVAARALAVDAPREPVAGSGETVGAAEVLGSLALALAELLALPTPRGLGEESRDSVCAAVCEAASALEEGRAEAEASKAVGEGESVASAVREGGAEAEPPIAVPVSRGEAVAVLLEDASPGGEAVSKVDELAALLGVPVPLGASGVNEDSGLMERAGVLLVVPLALPPK